MFFRARDRKHWNARSSAAVHLTIYLHRRRVDVAAHGDWRAGVKQAWSRPMRSLPAVVIGLLLISGAASAQDCGPFFWFCQRQAPQASEPPPSPRAWHAGLEQQSTGA